MAPYCLLLLAMLAFAARAQSLSLAVNAPHLFLDFDGMASVTNLTIALGQLNKDYSAPVVAPEQPWEAFLDFYSSLVLVPAAQTGTGAPAYYLYYTCVANGSSSDSEHFACLSTSADGRTWVKPSLPAFPWTDGRPTNRVFSLGAAWPGTVFIDASAPPAARFKLTFSADCGGTYGGVYFAASPDGLHFSAPPNSSCVDLPLHYGDTQNAVFWDAQRSRYAMFGRGDSPAPGTANGCGGGTARQVLVAFSTAGAEGGYGNASLLLNYGAPDQLDCLDLYAAVPLPLGPSALLLLPPSFRHMPAEDSVSHNTNDGVLDVRLAVSRDGGATAAFVSRDAFLPRGTGAMSAPSTFTGDADAGLVFATAGGLVDPDALAAAAPAPPSPRVWLLYYATQRTHFPSYNPALGVPGFNGILRASMRREGFAGLRTPPGDPVGAGAFTTAPLAVPQPATACGNATAQLWLMLNVQSSAAGGAAVALLNPGSLAPLPGRGLGDALTFVGDGVRTPVGWRAAAGGLPLVRDLAPFAGTEVVVQVTLVHAQLWAWEVQCVFA